ncbi:MAG: hypothetical protein J6T84_11815 [Spirochaetaceae bacterium]|nr:hypothetical protein [Spirochaetaceae bacterium]
MMNKLINLQNEWVKTSIDSEMGLWWLANDVREIIGNLPEQEICSLTLNLIKPLLIEKKLLPITLNNDGTYKVWSEEPSRVIEKIRNQWLSLGRKPTIDDIVWFIGSRNT